MQLNEMRNADRGMRNEVSRISNSKFSIIMANLVLQSTIRISSPLSVIRILPMLPEEMFVEQTIRDCGGRGI